MEIINDNSSTPTRIRKARFERMSESNVSDNSLPGVRSNENNIIDDFSSSESSQADKKEYSKSPV